MTSTYRVFALLILGAGLAHAASAQRLLPQWSVQGSVMIPQGQFADALLGREGIGVSGYFGVGIVGTPLVMGVEASYNIYGLNRYEGLTPWFFSYHVPAVTLIEQVMSAHVVLRLQWQDYDIQPYAEGLLGMKYFETTTAVDDGDYHVAYLDASRTALSYGVGGGLEVFAGRVFEVDLYVNAGIRYLYGSRASYTVLPSDTRYSALLFDARDTYRTRTDVLVAVLGLSFWM